MSKRKDELLIPNFEQFGYYLYDRIYVMLEHYGLLKHKFTIFLVLLDRSKEEYIKKRKFVFAGLKRQREFLKAQNDGLDGSWEKLAKQAASPETFRETHNIMKLFESNILEIDNLTKFKSFTKDYFTSPRDNWHEVQRQEYAILKKNFEDLESLFYTSLPVFQFGKLEGAAHFVIEEREIEENKTEADRKEVFLQMIRLMTREYENLIWIWNLKDEDLKDAIARRRLDMLDEAIERIKNNQTPLLKRLNYIEYYKNSREYYEERIQQNETLLDKFQEENRRRAITSILIDSYSHNISAHSLTTLKWWFQQRSTEAKVDELIKELEKKYPIDQWVAPIGAFLEREFPDVSKRAELTEGAKLILARWFRQLNHQEKNGPGLSPVITQLHPVSPQLTPLFKFLMEKGAFWSGIIRDTQFGGEIKSLYEILWEDFVKNPLYLGTIAHSEGIKKIHIRVVIYDYKPFRKDAKFDKEPLRRTYPIKHTDDGNLLDGVLATIDVTGKEDDQAIQRHRYYQKGDDYKNLKSELEQCRVFFPGGVVGKHAFFTLIENEIRNVKHFGKSAQQEMIEEGLTLSIGIRPAALSRRVRKSATPVLYKIGVWLDHKTNLVQNGKHLVLRRMKDLDADIITKDNRAKLGGNYQDKICAAMLFNNNFSSVQLREEKKLSDCYYPWIRSAFSSGRKSGETEENNFEVQLKNLPDAEEQLANNGFPEKGYFKKFFHVWQGDFVFKLSNPDDLELENIARFKIISISDEKLMKNAREKGVIRILAPSSNEWKSHETYKQWLYQWLGQRAFSICIKQGDTPTAYIIYDPEAICFFNNQEYKELESDTVNDFADYRNYLLPFSHRHRNQGNDQINIRSHGILATRFFNDLKSIDDFSECKIKDQALLYELVEFLQTRICTFDSRISERITTEKQKLLKEHLNCSIFDEDLKKWEEVRQQGLDRYHFVILHLSFIESMTNEAGKVYGEEGIADFIREQIWNEEGQAPENFFFVVTTGRGRTRWWRELEKKENKTLRLFTTFRPIESLIEATERAIQIDDDIDLKYNLIKVLMGS